MDVDPVAERNEDLGVALPAPLPSDEQSAEEQRAEEQTAQGRSFRREDRPGTKNGETVPELGVRQEMQVPSARTPEVERSFWALGPEWVVAQAPQIERVAAPP